MNNNVSFNPQINEKLFGGFNGFKINPTRIAPTEINNTFGINIPKNCSYTTDENGNKISLGQDAVGCAHRDPSEFNFHMIG
jgi:hypothetical protein